MVTRYSARTQRDRGTDDHALLIFNFLLFLGVIACVLGVLACMVYVLSISPL